MALCSDISAGRGSRSRDLGPLSPALEAPLSLSHTEAP